MTAPAHQELFLRRITLLCEQILAFAHTFSASFSRLEEKLSGLDSLRSEQAAIAERIEALSAKVDRVIEGLDRGSQAQDEALESILQVRDEVVRIRVVEEERKAVEERKAGEEEAGKKAGARARARARGTRTLMSDMEMAAAIGEEVGRGDLRGLLVNGWWGVA